MRLSLLLTASLFLFSSTVLAQYTIDGANGASPLNVCSGSFIDNNQGGPYNDQSYTYTICADTPDDVVSLDFVLFGLTSVTAQNSDYLTIYDGPDTGSNSLGDYTGSTLQGLSVTATINNPSGCLTIVFTNNTGNSGQQPGWEALISCTTPCATPFSVSSITSGTPLNGGTTVTACIGEPVSFSAAGSTAEPGFTIAQYNWNFNDGNPIDSTSGVNVTHVFDEPGEYIVGSSVVDNNGCESLNLNPLQVLVATVPVMELVYDAEVCFGETVDMSGTAEGVTWTALPPQVVAGETFLPDDAGSTYTTSLVFDIFDPDATLESCDDLLDIYLNMEHSYLGDLQISITSPDNTTVNMLVWPNGGGGTFLGEANDNFGPEPGVGYEYGWEPGLTNGLLDDDANNTSITFVDTDGNTVTNNVVTPGFYQSEEDLCALVGSPLNGAWTISITDNIGIDNGTIFYWGIDFDPSLFPDVTTFTPTVGEEIDSTWWTGPANAIILDEGNNITFIPDNPGMYDFTFNTMNSFGCGNDTTITLNIEEITDIQCWPDVEIDCGEPTQIGVDLIDGIVTDYDFSWDPYDNLNNTSLQNPTVTNLQQSMTYEVTVFLEGHPLCFKTDQINVNIPGELTVGPDSAICGMQYQLAATSVGQGEWTIPGGSGLTLTGGANPMQNPNALISATDPGDYTITWTDLDGLSCPNTKDLQLSFFNGIEITPIVTDAFCYGECSGIVSVTGVGGDIGIDYTYEFVGVDPTGITGSLAEEVCPGPYSVILYDDNGCSDSESYFIGEPPAPVIDEVIAVREECFGYCNGTIQVISDEAVTYSYNDGFTFEAGSLKDGLCAGEYDVVIKDINGCSSEPTSTFVSSPTPPEANFSATPLPATIIDPQVSFINLSDDAVSATWIFNTDEPFGTSEDLEPKFIFPEVGVFPVQMTILDSLGCPADIIKYIEIQDVLELYIPTSFTPNEDGLNDLFSPVGSDIDPGYYFFRVFSRTGEEVYRSFTYPHAWNGESKAEGEYYVADGVYNWHLITKSKTTSKKIEKTGAIYIHR